MRIILLPLALVNNYILNMAYSLTGLQSCWGDLFDQRRQIEESIEMDDLSFHFSRLSLANVTDMIDPEDWRRYGP